MQCPKCQGECYDNRTRKAEGKISARAPDFACKDKDGCGWVQWPPRDKKAASAPSGAPGAPQREPGYSWGELALTFRRCHEIAAKVVGEKSPDLQSATATLFISATKMGLKVREATKPEEAPPPPRRPVALHHSRPEDFDHIPDALADNDDGLPF